jgi:type II secretory pathway component GspD/PulD (secretin)
MPRRRLKISLLLIGAAAFLTSITVLSDEARIIQLKHRTAREIIPLIQPMLGPYDALTGTDYRLIIRTPETSFREIERILLQVDVAQRRLQITVEQFAAVDRNQYNQSVSGSERIRDRARIVLPDKTPNEKGVVITKDNLRYSATKSAHAASNKNRQTVMTLDGQRAYIRVGQSVPQVSRILAISRKGAVIAQDVELRDVVSGFEVLPRISGEHVRIEITPRLSTLENPGTGLVNFQELTTTVEAKLGEWIDLGSILGNRSEIHRAILESGAINSNEHRIVRLRVE